MIKFDNRKHFIEANKFSRLLGNKSRESFKHCFRTLSNIHKNYPHLDLYIYPDFVKHSFAFGLGKYDENGQLIKRGICGGMILHGFEETYQVSLTSHNHPYWSIHT